MTPIILTAYRAGRLVWTGYLDEGPMLVRLHRRGVESIHHQIENTPGVRGAFHIYDLVVYWRCE